VARFGDVMNVVASTPVELRHKIDVLERHCEAVDRDPAEIRKTILTFLHVTEDAKEEARLRERYKQLVRTTEAQAALPIGPAGKVVEALAAFRDAGAEEVVVTDLPNDPDVYERVAVEVIGEF
jgi:alkanesulfonate monooxygenase SsuD/methylene tetrahydromethanopterin reductase-like flavin-dependent oxidoreductase (luciferase family)